MKSIIRSIGAMLINTLVVLVVATSAIGQDAAQADSKHYKVEFENDQVRVLRVNYGPKERSAMHYHPEGLAIALTNTNTQFTLADGKIEKRGFKAGEVLWTPAGNHLPENLGAKAFEVILIELKAGSGGGSMPSAADDSAKADPKHHKVEFENDRIRVLRSVIAPRAKTKMHAHPGNVVIFLTDANAKSTLADGQAEQIQRKAGQVGWRDYAKHDVQNQSNRPLEAITVELKGNQ